MADAARPADEGTVATAAEQATTIEVRPAEPSAPVLRFGKRYRSLALLGSGGMGSVYLARDEELGELVALKVLRPELVNHPAMLERFREEVRLARLVSSPLVARTHDLAEHEGRWFVTMQYVEGETLSAKLRREGPLSIAECVRIGRDVCEGLSAVHAAGVIHRDLKPGNVILSTAGRAVLADFGIAVRANSRVATDGSGTPTYTAPEQLAGLAVDARTDIFALGAMLYVLSTGQRPFPPTRTGAEPPPDPRHVVPGISGAFAAIVLRAMALEPRDRFASADALATALGAIRPAEAAAREEMLFGFVRSLATSELRTMALAAMRADGVDEALARAASDELRTRLHSRDLVRVVASEGDAEAVLDAHLVGEHESYTLELALRSRADGYAFWTETLRGAHASLPDLIERAAIGIERAFGLNVEPLCGAARFPSAEVARLFVEGRSEYRRYWGGRLTRAAELFERARALAPEQPLVLAWSAAALSRLRFFERGDRRSGESAHALAMRAVELAPHLAEAHIALAAAHMLEMRATEAMVHYIAALKIAPGLTEQRAHFARVLQEIGAERAAMELAESTFERDPSNVESLVVPVRHYALQKRLDLAQAQIARAPRGADTSFLWVTLARYCAWTRDARRFKEIYDRVSRDPLEIEPRRALHAVGSAFEGVAVTMATAEQAKDAPRRAALYEQLRAEIFGLLGDVPRCLAALESVSELGLFDISWLDRCALFDPLRGTVRFETVRHATHERAIRALREIERCLSQTTS